MTALVVLFLTLFGLSRAKDFSVNGASQAFGLGRIWPADLSRILADPRVCDIESDLAAFTGLAPDELRDRLMRLANHHFAIEHNFRSPKTVPELTWFYRSSVGYLFANAIHPVQDSVVELGSAADGALSLGPALCFAGGIGTNAIWLAEHGHRVEYFGIGMIEAEFAAFRAFRRGIDDDRLLFLRPYVKGKFDDINSLRSEPFYGAILAFDVFEHIPHYERVAARLAGSLVTGGEMIVNAPFNKDSKSLIDIHLRQDVPMAKALGPSMRLVRTGPTGTQVWRKE